MASLSLLDSAAKVWKWLGYEACVPHSSFSSTVVDPIRPPVFLLAVLISEPVPTFSYLESSPELGDKISLQGPSRSGAWQGACLGLWRDPGPRGSRESRDPWPSSQGVTASPYSKHGGPGGGTSAAILARVVLSPAVGPQSLRLGLGGRRACSQAARPGEGGRRGASAEPERGARPGGRF